jgi:O-antigen ligase
MREARQAVQAPAAAQTGVDLDTLVRSVLFVAVFLAVWISFHPFKSLADPVSQVNEGGDVANQIGFSAIFLMLAGWMCLHEPSRLMLLLRPALLAILAWLALSVLASWEPMLAARRTAFMLVIMSIAGMTLLLPKNLRHFADLLAITVLIVLAVCYLGVLLVPQLAMHQATDYLEPAHEGDWRGVFEHKNEAGANMVLFIFVGMFVARVRSFALGGVIVALATIFLLFTQSKTAIGVLIPVMVISHVIIHSSRPRLGLALTIGVIAAFNLASVGSVIFAPVRDLISAIMPDATYTGRTEIWQFGLDHVLVHPIFGYGFGAFWGTDEVVYGMANHSLWANTAEHAHNSYLNLALSVGLPGLALIVLWSVILPITDFCKLPPDAPSRPLQILFLRACLFGMLASCFESVIFQELAEGSFLFMVGALGLRYLSATRIRI